MTIEKILSSDQSREKVSLAVPAEGEVLLGRTVTAGGKEIVLDRLSMEGDLFCPYYGLPGRQGYFPAYLPEFRLAGNAGRSLGFRRNYWENETGG